ncbi:MAG: ABC transporter ATP-binding protein [Chloroflexota bacterium]|nr:ABC transporter ATP-binding protein [Chloroflexota bacterium]
MGIMDTANQPAAAPLVPRIMGTFRPYSGRITLVGLLILVTAGLGVVNPVLIQVVFDQALFPESGGPDLGLLWVLAGVMAGVTVVTGGLGIVQTYWTNLVGQRVMRDLRDTLYRHLQSLSLGFFTDTRTGEIQSRVANDVGGVQRVVTNTVSDVLSNCVILISTVVAMLVLSWELTVVAVASAPVFFLISRVVGAKRRAIAAEAQRSTAEMTAITQETLSISGIMLAKLFGRQNREIDRFHHENQRLSDLIIRQQMTGQSFFTLMQLFFSVSPVAIYLLAGYLLVGAGGLSPISAGTVVAFTTLQSRLYFPIGRLLEVSVELQSSLALFERIFGYLDIEPEIVDEPGAIELEPAMVRGAVSFDSVRVNYSAHRAARQQNWQESGPGVIPADDPNPQQWALDGVSFKIRPGQLAAFVGPSGAGKTTISYLIPRLYDATEGSISIDGIDVRQIRQASLAGLTGYVTQESYLFHASIRENLLYGNPRATSEELAQAARAAYIHERIMEFPEGYDTVVGERGYRLSGGERQRLAIARVILHQPRILILDEATSALDTASERYVQSALEPLMRGRTTVAIAHRLSTIMAADVIYVIDHGRVVEEGSHPELLARGGLYAHLYEEQFEGGEVECYCEDGVVMSDGEIVVAEPAAALST